MPFVLIHLIYLGEKVLLTTPTTPTDRMKAIVEVAEGFVYLVRFYSGQYYKPFSVFIMRSECQEVFFFYLIILGNLGVLMSTVVAW